ncbi:MAG: hypothetical protein WBQ64_07055, partial [Terriglobales bacterium]
RMSKNHRKLALSCVLVLAFCTSLYAQRGRWTYLGDSHVDGSVDHDSIKVGRSDGSFRAIRLRVSGGAINFERVVVRFGNGTQEEIPIRSRIPNGGQTRAIDLPGERRMIQSLDLWYSKDHWSRRPKVTLYGMR